MGIIIKIKIMKANFLFLLAGLFGLAMANHRDGAWGDNHIHHGWADDATDCDPAVNENCAVWDSQWYQDRQKWIKFGVLSWFRAFDGCHILTFLPTASIWARVFNYHWSALPKFIWAIQWLTGVGGWVTSLGNLGIAAWNIYEFTKDINSSWNLSFGVAVIVTEIVGWALYYAWSPGAMRFNEHLSESENQVPF